ncbi:MAG: CesT family type III secretion system chaperone [Cryomorphaceae bacterium]
MSEYFEKIKEYTLELGCEHSFTNQEEGVLVIAQENAGIKNLVLAMADPILIIEQFLFEINTDSATLFRDLLKKNRDIVHGAFALDETGRKVIFRDTLQLENLDLNELEGSINSLSLLLSEYSDELIRFSKN